MSISRYGLLNDVSIDPSHKTHNALDKYLTMHHFITEMCIYMHISAFLLKMVHCGAGASWDLCNISIPRCCHTNMDPYPHYKNKMISWQSYLYDRNTYTWKDSIYIEMSLVYWRLCLYAQLWPNNLAIIEGLWYLHSYQLRLLYNISHHTKCTW